MSTLFISHSSRDNEVAERLRDRLAEQGHRSVFLDLDPEVGIQAGVSWERTLYTKLRACRAVVALCSDSYLRSQWCFAEIALARMEGKEIFALKIEPWSDGTQMPSILTEDQFIDVRSDPEEGYRRLWNGFRVKGIVPAEHRDWAPNDPPYPGLRAFRGEDAPIFFGREAEVTEGTELLNQVVRQGHPRLVMVLGSSGSGKSSLVGAGIVPQLKLDRKQWTVVPPFRPGAAPLRELSVAFSDAFAEIDEPVGWEDIHRWLEDDAAKASSAVVDAMDLTTPGNARERLLEALAVMESELSAAGDHMLESVHNLRSYLSREPDDVLAGGLRLEKNALVDLGLRLRMAARAPDAPVVLVIDQFEELLGHEPDHPATRFLSVLRVALDSESGPFLVIGTMRSDFLGQLQAASALQGLGRKDLSVGPMSREGMRQIIEEPAKLGQIQLQEGLADLLLDDTRTSDALPLLAFTLRIMWDRYRDDRLLEIREYKDLGGLQGAIAKVAEETYEAALDRQPDDRARAAIRRELQDAFLSMARPAAEGVGWSRQPVSWSDLSATVRPVLEPFIDPQRLLVKREDGTVEVAHEALFRSWDRLKGWLDENAESLHLRHDIQNEARNWDAADAESKAEYLWTGGRLARAQELRDGGMLTLETRDASFIEASLRAERAAAEAKEAARRQRRNLLAGGLVASLMLSAIALFQWWDAEVQRLAAETNRKMALAQVFHPDPAFGRMITREVPGSPAGWMEIAADQIRRRHPRIFTLPDGGDAAPPQRDDVRLVAYGEDGVFATGHADNAIWVWKDKGEDGYDVRLLGRHAARLWDLSFQRNGRLLASSDNDGIVKIWDTGEIWKGDGDPKSALKYELKAPRGVALRARISTNGELAAALLQDGYRGPKAVSFWRLSTDRSPPPSLSTPFTKAPHISALDLSSDGSRVLVGRSDGVVVELSTADGSKIRDVRAGEENGSEVHRITYGNEDHQWAFVDKKSQLFWHNSGVNQRKTLSGSYKNTIKLRINSKFLFVSSGQEIHIGFWDVAKNSFPKFTEFYDRDRSLVAADFDGERLLVSTKGISRATKWELRPGPDHRVLATEATDRADNRAVDMAYLPDGRLLVAYACGGVRLWSDLGIGHSERDGRPRYDQIRGPVPDVGCEGSALTQLTAFSVSAKGDRFAIGLRDGRIFIGEVAPLGASWDQPVRLPPSRPVGPNIGTCELGRDGVDAGDRGQEGRAPNTVWSVAFNKTAGELIAGFQDGTVRILDLGTGQWREVAEHAGPVCAVDWSGDGRRLLSASRDKTVRVWHAEADGGTDPVVLRHQAPVFTASFDISGQQVITGAEDFAVRNWWNLDGKEPERRELTTHGTPVHVARFNSRGNWALSAAGDVLRLNCARDAGEPGMRSCKYHGQNVAIFGANRRKLLLSVAISPDRPQFAAIDETGEVNLYRTDYRVALWRQQPYCMRAVDRIRFLGDQPEQARASVAACQRMVASCRSSSAECARALAEP